MRRGARRSTQRGNVVDTDAVDQWERQVKKGAPPDG